MDSSKAEQSISKAEQKAEGMASKLGNGIKTAGKWGMAIGAGAMAAGAAIGGVVMKAADAAGALDDTSKKVGMSAEEYQKYAYAAKLSGMESATLEKAMIKQQKAFADAKTGSKSMSEAYAKLGVDINKIGTSGEAFDLVIKKLADMDDETQRNALANDIFGKSYAELGPLLSEGAAGIEAMKKEAVDMGAVMSNESVSAGAEFGDMLDKAKMSLNGTTNEIGIAFMPTVQKLLDWVMAHMPEIKETIKSVFSVIGKIVEAAGKVFEGLLPILEPLWDFVSWAFPKILDVVTSVFGAIEPIIKAVGDAFEAVADAIQWAYDKWMEWTGRKADTKKPANDIDDKPGKPRKPSPHASGLAYVPYDGYVAELHKGERVLTRGEVAAAGMGSLTINITGNNISSDYDVDRIAERIIKKLGREERRNR